jgi:hypothetical protein
MVDSPSTPHRFMRVAHSDADTSATSRSSVTLYRRSSDFSHGSPSRSALCAPFILRARARRRSCRAQAKSETPSTGDGRGHERRSSCLIARFRDDVRSGRDLDRDVASNTARRRRSWRPRLSHGHQRASVCGSGLATSGCKKVVSVRWWNRAPSVGREPYPIAARISCVVVG